MGRLAALTAAPSAHTCLAGLALTTLRRTDPETADELQAALALDSGIRHSDLARALDDLPEITFRVPDGTIGRHRRGDCACARGE